MDDDTLRSIGELAGLTGLTVKTIRFWSDAGVLPPTARTPAGYRLYGQDALVRLGLVRTLRDLGVDLAAIQRVLAQEIGLAEVAAVHAEALDAQIRTLQLRRAILRAAAGRGATPEEMELMHRLAKLSDRERTGLINDFIDQVFEGLDVGPEFLAGLQAAMPRLPDDPTAEQVDAWVELAELVQDPEFRAGVRRAAADQVGSRDQVAEPDPEAAARLADLLRGRTAAARAAGVGPASAAARPVVDELVGAYARLSGREDGPEFRAWLLERLEVAADSRYERYWHLVAVVDGRPPAPALAPAVEWLVGALRAA
ncbi:MerR family transcriptional regulator [Kitasatospora sp. NBC_00240]|uniref:MerR family transcriptional regulator n=1 Tax=Kitasatospora sp. NBC_00240 TaxID=2903567 RepID=UPI00225B40E8|nr:MerR family transcriptional regulator [Kitasatospora sp. NBC_00240]MCX5213861.1 MerR family transcriptional regulator [Kitasatospora sp. NBC_00240]